jgi:hypothetical protein
MTAALATLHQHKNILLIDVALLVALYLVPSLAHLTALPLYMLEPMRVALCVSLLFTNRTNAYFIALTIPLASAMITGHPPPLKAALMGIEFSILVVSYSYLAQRLRISAFAALSAGILLSKLAYYTMKFVALSTGLLAGSLISTPLQIQLVVAVGTAAVFGLIEHYRTKNNNKQGSDPRV